MQALSTARPALRPRTLWLGVPVFVAAGLLFAIEPMLAKLMLPALGGAPATWAGCLVAFQLLLLLGYGYAHVGARYLSLRQQALIHLALLAAACLSLLVSELGAGHALGALPALGTLPPALAVPWLVLRRVGLPFAVLASTTPLLSRWAGLLGWPGRGLYAVSNAGALLALLAYPALLEPRLGLPGQLALWAGGFVAFSASLVPAGALALRRRVVAAPPSPRAAPLGRKLYCLVCAFLPSALLLAVTNHITVDIAATPVLWVVPLGLYLASFVAVFSRLRRALRGPALVMWLTGTLWLALNGFGQGAVSLFAQLAAALLTLSGAALLCHGELARLQPPEADATGYYLILAGGGALGGVFVSLGAPLLFSDLYELELLCLATFVVLLSMVRQQAEHAPSRRFRLLFYLGVGLCVPSLVAELLTRHASTGLGGRVVERRRSFLGPLRVVDVADGRVLTHGRIQHGMQLRAPAQRRDATLYFASDTAVARVLERFALDRPRRLAVVGLGVGTLASYGRAGDSLRFYELDPNVIELARSRFSFLADSPARVSVVAGDGRLALGQEPSRAFDVLVLDAFSSDAVPVHLLTREAFTSYAQKLALNGVLLANVSNRHVAVERVACASAHAVGFGCRVVETKGNPALHGVPVAWAVMARSAAALDDLTAGLPNRAVGAEVLWTDDRNSLFSVLR